MRTYERILKTVGETPWAIRPEVLRTIVELLAMRAKGVKLSEEEIQARIGSRDLDRAEPRGSGRVRILSIYGPIFPKANLMTEVSGATSLETFRAQLREALSEDGVDAIVLDIDSPGGIVSQVPETGEVIRAARGGKPIVAVANVMAASAAYWLGAQADEFVASPSGRVGSIGVYTAHEDWSKHDDAFGVKTTLVSAGKFKTEGNPFEPLDDETRAAMQAEVDEIYEMFLVAVAAGRGTTVDIVRAGFGQGRVVLPPAALAAGMIDRIETLEDTVRRLGGVAAVPLVRPDEDDQIPPPDEEPESAVVKPVRSDAFVRAAVAFDDLAVKRGSDGRTIDSYAAVYDAATQVTDFYYVKDNPFQDEFGTYLEVLRRSVFSKSLQDRGLDFQVMFNHGRDVFGRPLERFAMPLAVPIEITSDARGLRTVFRIAKTELGDEVLELIDAGAIRTMSFSGRPLQTRITRGGRGEPDTLERLEIALKEFGPAIFPAYNDARIVGVRAEALAHQLAYLPANERARLASLLQGTPLQAAQPGTDQVEPSAPGDTPDVGPSPQLLRLRQEQRRRLAGR